jgi:hypothetical protein
VEYDRGSLKADALQHRRKLHRILLDQFNAGVGDRRICELDHLDCRARD